MKILLIQPPSPPSTIGGDDVFLYEPLALEYLAAAVQEEHTVKILDLRLDDLSTTIHEFRPDVVGITAYTVHVNVVRNLFKQIKGWNPRILTVVGGHHATVIPEDFHSPSVDLIVTGEGVSPFREIIARRTRGATFGGIAGVTRANEDHLTTTGFEAATDLDSLPFPARRLTAKYRKHYFSEWMKPLASIRTSKGCPFRCRFCAQWKVSGGRYFKREPEKIVRELSGIAEEFVFFADDESLVDAPRMERLARLIKERGIRKRYFLYARSDTVVRNPELLGLWRDIGLERIFVGFEFFRDTDLDYIRKHSSCKDNERAIRILHDLGIEIYASFILRPEFTKADFASLTEHCRRLRLSFATFAVLTPLPGTDLYTEVADRLIVRNYDYFDFIHTLLPTTLPLEEFYTEYYNLYKGAIPVRRQLSLLRKYRLRDIRPVFARAGRFYKRLETAHMDYPQGGIQ